MLIEKIVDRIWVFATNVMLGMVLGMFVVPALAQENIALNKTTASSANESTSLASNKAVDGISTTRWASSFANNQWITVDLGEVANISSVILRWEEAFALKYHIDISQDGTAWSRVFTESEGNGGVDTIPINLQGRHVRMFCEIRGTEYGCSLWELEVYKASTNTPPPEQPPTNVTLTQFVLEWDVPKYRENGNALSVAEIGGYEIYGYNDQDVRVYTKVVNGGNVTRLEENISDTLSVKRLTIATFDTEGLFSEFVPITATPTNTNKPPKPINVRLRRQ